jgi:uncharacterized membrane protein
MKPKTVHTFFLVAIFLKALNGILEVISGFLLLAFSPASVLRIVELMTLNELGEDPTDLLSNYLLTKARGLTLPALYYASFFLVSHGVIKIGLVGALFERKLWAYPAAIAIFGLFIIFQMFRFFVAPSMLMAVLSIFDVFVIILTYLEYRNLTKSLL